MEHVSYNVSGMNYIKENMHAEGEGHVVIFLAYFPFLVSLQHYHGVLLLQLF